MTDATITEEELAAFIGRNEEAASAYMRGDMDRYLELITHSVGFTLMAPYGGGPTRHEHRSDSVRASADYFKDGESKLEQVQSHAWGDTVVLTMIERQHGQVGGRPDADCSLRVTLVFRRDGSDWQLVHRHADPLVHPITLEQMAALISG